MICLRNLSKIVFTTDSLAVDGVKTLNLHLNQLVILIDRTTVSLRLVHLEMKLNTLEGDLTVGGANCARARGCS